jgi:hypothetical protein
VSIVGIFVLTASRARNLLERVRNVLLLPLRADRQHVSRTCVSTLRACDRDITLSPSPSSLQVAFLKKATAFFTLFMMIMSWIMEGEMIQKVHAATADGPGFKNNFFITFCTRVRAVFRSPLSPSVECVLLHSQSRGR